jgi:ABC-type transport system involved in cytochrome c biogenesis permease subunit
MKRISLHLLAVLISTASIASSFAELSTSALDSLIIQEGGRKKPYLVFSEEILRSLTGKTSIALNGPGSPKKEAVDVVTGIWMDPSTAWRGRELILLSNRPLKKRLGLDPTRKLFSWNELMANDVLGQDLLEASETQKRDPRAKLVGMQKEASDVAMRMNLLENLLRGDSFRILPPDAGNEWLAPSPEEMPLTALRGAWNQGKQQLFDRTTEEFKALVALTGAAPPSWKISLEVDYQKTHPFRWAWILYAASGIILLISQGSWERWGYRAAASLAAIGFLLQACGLISRVLIAGRPPVTNMYESVIWVAFGTILFALIFELIYKAGSFLLGAVPVAVASLILADSQPVILDRSIHPLTPVLRDNFWLTTHVLSITLSYAAFALALGVAHIALGRVIAGRKASDTLYTYLYKTLQVGVLLLAIGTILGGVWANYSWGRFWDWDPKETWALTALLGYLFLLHGRLTGLWGGFGLAVGSVLAFMSVLMAWYGVNFVLGAGLHSYGFGTGGFPLVITFVAFELLFLLVAFLRKKNTQQRA